MLFSGLTALETALVASSLAGAAASAGTGIASAVSQKNALQQQKKAQQEATARAASAQRESEIRQNMASRKEPDVATIMANAAKAGGPSGTMLTGPGGVNPSSLSLGKSSLLGG